MRYKTGKEILSASYLEKRETSEEKHEYSKTFRDRRLIEMESWNKAFHTDIIETPPLTRLSDIQSRAHVKLNTLRANPDPCGRSSGFLQNSPATFCSGIVPAE